MNYFKQLISLHILLSIWFHLSAQDYPAFVQLNQNRIIFDKDSSDFYKFVSKLINIKKGRKDHLYIVHFGGSHVQGGFWSEGIMNTLQEYFQTKGGGYYVFPFKQVHTNSPHYFKTYSNGKWTVNKCTKITDSLSYIGMCGISSITDSTCYLAIKNKWKGIAYFTTIKIFHRKNDHFDIIPQFPIRKTIHTEYSTEYELLEATDSIAVIIQKKDSTSAEFILDGISCENDSAGVYYAGFGVNGATSESFLKCQLLLHQLSKTPVDLFILSFGVNDVRSKTFSKSKYIQHYDSLISILRKTHPESSILITTISDNYIKRKYANVRTKYGNEAIFELLKKYQIAVWDLNTIMGGQKSMYKWYKAGLSAKDKIHFTKKGYFILGELLAKAILNTFH